jgi:hypothetical protein
MASRSLAAVLAAVLGAAAPFAARAGLVVTMKEGQQKSVFSVDGKKMRIEGGEDRKHVMIFDGGAQRLYQIDPGEKTWSEVTQADAKAVAAQLDEMLAKLPPEQRAKAQEAMKQRGEKQAESPTQYEATGKHDKVAGYACDWYRVVRLGKLDEEGCYIPWSAGVVKKDDLAPLIEFGKFMDEFMASAYGKVGGDRKPFRIADELARAPGFPALSVHVEDGKREERHRLETLTRTSVAADQFTVPAGYTKVPHPMLGGGRRGKSE